MAIELWLNFKDEKGETKRILVEGEKFVIGRTPDNDLQISLGSLSRQHAKIERFADVFIISDCGSSNGTTLNNENLEKPIALKNEDKLNLGDAVEIEIELGSEKSQSNNAGGGSGGNAGAGDDGGDEETAAAAGSSGSAGSATSASASASASDKSSISFGFIILAPILGVFALLIIGGVILLASGKKEEEVVINNNRYQPSDGEDENVDLPESNKTPEKNATPTPATNVTPSNTSTPENSSTPENISTPASPEPSEEVTNTPNASSDKEKIDKASTPFLKRIAHNDPRPFLTDEKIAKVVPKINQMKNSGGLAQNIRNAKKNLSELQTLADSRDLKPQLLVNAALTKLGTQSGDVVAAAKEILEPLSSINKTFGSESADESLLIVAAYSNNTSGESLQNAAGGFTLKFPKVGARTIRSIWFFKDNGKLTDSQFDFALRFLAIGIITQNPKDFNVQAEALAF